MKPSILINAQPQPQSAFTLGLFGVAHDTQNKNPTSDVKFAGKSDGDTARLLKLLEESKHFSGKKGESSLLRFVPSSGFAHTLLLGLGKTEDWTSEIARQIGASLYSIQKRERLESIVFRIDSLLSGKERDRAPVLEAFFEGYWLGAYEFVELKKKDAQAFYPKTLHLVVPKGLDLTRNIERAEILANAVNFARYLGDRPGNLMTPSDLASHAEKMAKAHKLKCTVWGREQIEKEKMGLLLGVARGSHEEPKFIRLEYHGGKKGERPIILIGKGVTFDSGGISLKPAARMEDMKYDMMGSATVLGAMQAISELKPKVNVYGIVAATENMPDGRAQKPGDVATSLSGKTVEIINTDAEGRLILADALEYAQKLDPQAILDFATLTGAVVDALGTVASGIMGNHDALIEQVKRSAAATGERVWQLPLYDEYMEDLKSNVADIKNSGVREAGSSKGGIFLKYFVDSKYPWVHCDIAGTAYHRKDVSYHPSKNGSGVLVRLVSHLVENWKPLST